MRICGKCGVPKVLTEFPLQRESGGKSYPHSNCRACRRQQCREWAKTDQGKAVKRRGILRRMFGLTDEGYQAMHDAQGGLCEICGRPETKVCKGTITRLGVDHDHVTGRVRGLLCSDCNFGLGCFGDDQDRLIAAVEYLKKNR